MNLYPSTNTNPYIFKKNFIQETQKFIISKTPYDINIPDEITCLPKKKGYFESFLRRIVQTFQQNCRKKQQKSNEFLEFNKENSEQLSEFKSVRENLEDLGNFSPKSLQDEDVFINEEDIMKKNLDLVENRLKKPMAYQKMVDFVERKNQNFEENVENLENEENFNKFEKNKLKEGNETKVHWKRKEMGVSIKKTEEIDRKMENNGDIGNIMEDFRPVKALTKRKSQNIERFLGKRKRMHKKMATNYKKHKKHQKPRKNRPEVDLSGLPRKRLHEDITIKDLAKPHKKYEFTSLDFNDSNDDTQSDQTSKNNEIAKMTQEIYSKLEGNDKFHGLVKPEIVLEIIRQNDDNEEKEKEIGTPKTNELKKKEEILNFSEKNASKGKQNPLFLEPNRRFSDEIKPQSRKESRFSDEIKPQSRKESMEIQRTPMKAELLSLKPEPNIDIKLNISSDKSHIFEPKSTSVDTQKTINIIIDQNKNTNELNEKPVDTPQKNPQSRKNSMKTEEKPKENTNPFLVPNNQFLNESLQDFLNKMTNTNPTANEKEKTITNEEKPNNSIFGNISVPPSNQSLYHNIDNKPILIDNPMTTPPNSNTPLFNNNNNPPTNSNIGLFHTLKTPPTNTHSLFNSNDMTSNNNNNLLNSFAPFNNNTNNTQEYLPPLKINENSSNFLSQNSTNSNQNSLFSNMLASNNIPNQFTSNFASKPSGGLFGNLLATTDIYDFKGENQGSGSIFGGLLTGMNEQNNAINAGFGGNRNSKKKKQRVHS